MIALKAKKPRFLVTLITSIILTSFIFQGIVPVYANLTEQKLANRSPFERVKKYIENQGRKGAQAIQMSVEDQMVLAIALGSLNQITGDLDNRAIAERVRHINAAIPEGSRISLSENIRTEPLSKGEIKSVIINIQGDGSENANGNQRQIRAYLNCRAYTDQSSEIGIKQKHKKWLDIPGTENVFLTRQIPVKPRIEAAVAVARNKKGRREPLSNEVARAAEIIKTYYNAEGFGSKENWSFAVGSLKELSAIDPNTVRETLSYKFAEGAHTLADYRQSLVAELGAAEGNKIIDDLTALADYLKSVGKTKIVLFNATFVGGGVARVLETTGSIMKTLGIDLEWHILYPKDPAFYEMTSTVHNLIQGIDEHVGDEAIRLWDTVNKDNAEILRSIFSDESVGAIFIEDPQVAPLVQCAKQRNGHTPMAWRLHIDIAGIRQGKPNAVKMWETIRDRVKHLTENDVALFQAFHVPPGLSEASPVNVFTQYQGIDTLADKNRLMDEDEMEEAIRELNKHMIDAGVPIDPKTPTLVTGARFDCWKGIEITLRAFEMLAGTHPGIRLVIFGEFAPDNPKGLAAYTCLRQMIERSIYRDRITFIKFDKRARFLKITLGKCVAALYRLSAIHKLPFIALSLREGYNIMLPEASAQNAAVLTSDAGGLKRYVDGVDAWTVAVEDIVDKIEDASRLYRWEGDRLVVDANAQELERRLHTKLDNLLSLRRDDEEEYNRQHTATVGEHRKMTWRRSILSMVRNYLAVAAVSRESIQRAAKAEPEPPLDSIADPANLPEPPATDSPRGAPGSGDPAEPPRDIPPALQKPLTKIKMIMQHRPVWERELLEGLSSSQKYIRLDIDELNNNVITWLKGLSSYEQLGEGRRSPFVLFSSEGNDIAQFLETNGLDKTKFSLDKDIAGVPAQNKITLFDLERVAVENMPKNSFCLPLFYSVSSIYLAYCVLVSEGDITRIESHDSLVYNTIISFYEVLFGAKPSTETLNALFIGNLPAIELITTNLDLLRLETAALERAA